MKSSPKMGFRSTSEVVLAAFSPEIASYLADNDSAVLLRVSRLLRVVYTCGSSSEERERRTRRLVAFVSQQPQLLKAFKQLLHGPQHSKPARRGVSVRLSDSQLHPLLRDLLLVGVGVRASCLVDTFHLEDMTVQRVLESFAESPLWRAYSLHRLRAIHLAGNVFFVNLNGFVRLKSRDVASEFRNVGLIDASATLETPRAISLSNDDDVALREKLLESTRELVDKLLAPARDTREIIRIRTANATAMAGLLLCYPVVYHVDSGEPQEIDDEVAFWTTSDNCLSMVPLYLLQSSISVNQEDTRHQLPLQGFSVPQHLVGGGFGFPRLKTISRSCRRCLTEAIGDSSNTIGIHVELTQQTLPQVAL